ncbi:MAG: M23 family metallopeptidase [Mariprofundales bacterium]|nr:M23 family metallopeptidase [Mariprofundales bacterium]
MGWRQACLMVAIVLLAVGWRHSVEDNHALQARLAQRAARSQQDASFYQYDLAQLEQGKRDQEQRLHYMTRNLGVLEARINRLDSLGARLVAKVKLDPQMFAFDHLPAIGGGDIAAATRIPEEQHLEDQVDLLLHGSDHLGSKLDSINFYLMLKHDQHRAKPHLWPVDGGWLSSNFGLRVDPFSGRMAFHYGVDIADHIGENVRASAAGVVVFAGADGGYGHLVELDHGFGYRTRYAHLHDTVVQVGDVVKAGSVVGHIGSTGHSTGPHLHYEVRLHGRCINPANYLPSHHS